MVGRHKPLAIAGAAVVVLMLLPGGIASPAEAPSVISSTFKPGGFQYDSELFVADKDGAISYVNLDVTRHDVVAVATGAVVRSYCSSSDTENGTCPLFATPVIPGLGNTAVVEGTEDLVPGVLYDFYCTVHPWMKAQLLTL